MPFLISRALSCLVSRQRNFSSPVPVKDSSIPAVDMPRYDLKPSEMGLREEVSRRQVPWRIHIGGRMGTVTRVLKHHWQFFCRNRTRSSFHPDSFAGIGGG